MRQWSKSAMRTRGMVTISHIFSLLDKLELADNDKVDMGHDILFTQTYMLPIFRARFQV